VFEPESTGVLTGAGAFFSSRSHNTAGDNLAGVMSTNIPVAFLVLGALLSLYVIAALWRSRPK
jgi:hypothetical protein